MQNPDKTAPDIVFVDINMPFIDGLELSGMIIQQDKITNNSVIFAIMLKLLKNLFIMLNHQLH
jgi:CheY-like chemotaxis protein